jgi:hypothetical protein
VNEKKKLKRGLKSGRRTFELTGPPAGVISHGPAALTTALFPNYPCAFAAKDGKSWYTLRGRYVHERSNDGSLSKRNQPGYCVNKYKMLNSTQLLLITPSFNNSCRRFKNSCRRLKSMGKKYYLPDILKRSSKDGRRTILSFNAPLIRELIIQVQNQTNTCKVCSCGTPTCISHANSYKNA